VKLGRITAGRPIEGRLAAERRQHRVRLLGLDHLLEHFRRERLDIGPVSRTRIGHDRGRVGVDQHDPVAILPQRLAGLGAGIVELAGLADDDRAGANEQDRVEVVAAGHWSAGRQDPDKTSQG
jgi:hypothetical protein